MRGRSVSGMPMPVSLDLQHDRVVRRAASGPRIGPPSGVYLMALSTRLSRIWSDRLLVGPDHDRARRRAGAERGQRRAACSRPGPGAARGSACTTAPRSSSAMLERLGPDSIRARLSRSRIRACSRSACSAIRSRNRPRKAGVVDAAVEQRLDARLDDRQRRLQLVRDVGDELLPQPLQPAQLGGVVQHEHGARAAGRRAGGRRGPRSERAAGPVQRIVVVRLDRPAASGLDRRPAAAAAEPPPRGAGRPPSAGLKSSSCAGPVVGEQDAAARGRWR